MTIFQWDEKIIQAFLCIEQSRFLLKESVQTLIVSDAIRLLLSLEDALKSELIRAAMEQEEVNYGKELENAMKKFSERGEKIHG